MKPKAKRNLYGSQRMMITNFHSHYVAWSFVLGFFCFILNGGGVEDMDCHNCTAFFQESQKRCYSNDICGDN